jgi:hypothetical protein
MCPNEAQETGDATASVNVADQVWVVVALLHREHPDRVDFSTDEILGN